MAGYVLDLEEIDLARVAVAGGKGARLGELTRAQGVRVPAGFCVTTEAFQRALAGQPSFDLRLDRLSGLEQDDRDAIRSRSADVRRVIEELVMPDDLSAEITRRLARFGERDAYAVRSSATAEDLPAASFAGLHDTYLNVRGPAAILRHVSRCWASLFTDRAVTYRVRNGVDHRGAKMAVIVQRMVIPQAAGTLFTVDPVTSNRKVVSIEATVGLGDALVSGQVPGDLYQVRDGEVVAKAVATQRVASRPSRSGGTEQEAVEAAQQGRPALTDAQIVELAHLGRRVEAHFGHPQDIEWCLAGDGFQVVQSRPITTLFPIPQAPDQHNHVYVSVGHQQMMTDAMKPLGLSLWQLTTPRPMSEAGGRLFVDVTDLLASPASRARLVALARSDPLIGDALQTIVDRAGFIPEPGRGGVGQEPAGAPTPVEGAPVEAGPVEAGPVEAVPAVVGELVERAEISMAKLKTDIQRKSGPALLDFILDDLGELKQLMFGPQSQQAIMAAMEATWWLNEHMQAWLGESNSVDILAQSVPGNVTSEMGLELLDVADVVRAHPEVAAFLRQVEDEGFLDHLTAFPGGREAADAIRAYLAKYGMRGAGEIDVTTPRWSERPSALVPMILGHIKNFEPGEAARRFEQGRREAAKTEGSLMARLRALPDGERKADETKRMIDRLRAFTGYREYPKYHMIGRYFVYKQALLREAERLVEAHVLGDKEDIYYLRFQELHDVLRTNRVDPQLVRRRKEEFKSYLALTPPRVFTSDGEVVAGKYRRTDVPAGALVGLPVSAGTVEGRARVIVDLAKADLERGDILVTTYTDPSWTPAFVAIEGLVTEVGGLMTHGAVIAREYGLPAVVGVENATRLIADGRRIRVHGTAGYVEVLDQAPA